MHVVNAYSPWRVERGDGGECRVNKRGPPVEGCGQRPRERRVSHLSSACLCCHCKHSSSPPPPLDAAPRGGRLVIDNLTTFIRCSPTAELYSTSISCRDHVLPRRSNAYFVIFFQLLYFPRRRRLCLRVGVHVSFVCISTKIFWVVTSFTRKTNCGRNCTHCLNEIEPILGSCSFEKHELMLIISGKHHRHT